MEEVTQVKLIGEIDAELKLEDVEEEERLTSFTMFECMKCHWRFIGDCERYGYGYTSEDTQCPNFCPMCGTKISDDLAE